MVISNFESQVNIISQNTYEKCHFHSFYNSKKVWKHIPLTMYFFRSLQMHHISMKMAHWFALLKKLIPIFLKFANGLQMTNKFINFEKIEIQNTKNWFFKFETNPLNKICFLFFRQDHWNQGSQTRGPPDVFMRPALSSKLP